MHSIIIAAVFVLMVLAPCLTASRAGALEDAQ
jgi:hypothetical protein